MTIKNILVPYDFSDCATDALRVAARACAEGGTIIIAGAFNERDGAERSPRMRDLLTTALGEEAKKRRLVLVSDLDENEARAFGLESAPSLDEAPEVLQELTHRIRRAPPFHTLQLSKRASGRRSTQGSPPAA